MFGLAIALWSANAGMKAIIDALNVVYEETEKRGFFMLNLVSLAFTLGAVVAVLVAIGAVVVVPLLLDRVGLGAFTERLIEFGRWPALILSPPGYCRSPSLWGRAARGEMEMVERRQRVAATLWLAGSALFSFYLRNYANYYATYGSLGTGIGLMMWMWLSTIAVLFGAELNAEIEHQTARDTDDGRAKAVEEARRDDGRHGRGEGAIVVVIPGQRGALGPESKRTPIPSLIPFGFRLAPPGSLRSPRGRVPEWTKYEMPAASTPEEIPAFRRRQRTPDEPPDREQRA